MAMKLDNTAKVVAIFSTVVTALIAIAGFVGNQRLQKLQLDVNTLTKSDKAMDVDKKRYDYAARLTVDFSLPLARSFALQAADQQAVGRRIAIPKPLDSELMDLMRNWRQRKNLMTGKACQSEGLSARQIVTLVVGNIGSTDATDITLTLRRKRAPGPGSGDPWSERDGTGAAVGYDELAGPSARWETVEQPFGTLAGLGSPEANRVPLQIALASVSGTRSLFGTVLVPLKISWTDSVSNRRQSLPIYSEHAAELRASLLGAEIGSLRESCR